MYGLYEHYRTTDSHKLAFHGHPKRAADFHRGEAVCMAQRLVHNQSSKSNHNKSTAEPPQIR